MSIDFSTLKSLEIPEGVVTQITDASGRVIWAVQNNKPVVLQVEKITSNTYAGSTTYTGEQFILLDIYPKSANSTVKVTYGGLTKTLTFTGTNAQQVYFGTFNGVSDSVATPTSGELTIEGDYVAFAHGAFVMVSKGASLYCPCIDDVIDWGDTAYIPANAFHNNFTSSYANNALALTKLPYRITSIGDSAFFECARINITVIPEGVKTIGASAFHMYCALPSGSKPQTAMTEITFPTTLESIGNEAFQYSNNDGNMSVVSKVTLLSTTPPALGSNVFGTLSKSYFTNIIVPKGCGDIYKTAEGWSTYADFIVEAE